MPIASFDDLEDTTIPDELITPPSVEVRPDVEIIPEVEKEPDIPTSTPWVDSVAGYQEADPNYDVGGMELKVNYYQMARESGDVSDGVDSSVSSSYQQFIEVKNFILKAQTGFNFTTDPNTKETTIVIEAIVVDTLVANKGDMILCERNTGKASLLKVTTSERLSAFNNTGYRITATLIEETSINKIGKEHQALKDRVIQTLVYNPEHRYLGTKPTLTSEEVDEYVNRGELVKQLTNDYIRRYYQRQSLTLILPTVKGKLYDPYLTKFVMSILTTDLAIKHYTDANLAPITIFDDLMSGNALQSTFITDEVWAIECMRQHDLQFVYGIQYTDVGLLLRPKEPEDELSTTYDNYVGYGSYTTPITHLLSNMFSGESNVTPGLIPNMGDSYVLSKDYYNGNYESISLLEKLVRTWLTTKKVNLKELKTIIDEIPKFNELAMFYLVPIIIFLLSYS